ncbi:mannose-6-phosphate isomerase, class I [Corynebacterium marinum]|uniref:mannose-6-phosphate isomerase n=1 Tax=Corynebacterium marinum DSM 44953 TaxID=1224162 RepID=A0A0B6TPI3_9CORY|nr:mannose-6-phosphate isomerase, class I [Corynebacterium marinum]AJK68169.1 putative mannose-6-phosphate isomerase [Corynebacterium marinum DSM 44953]GGO10440.1 mannose-6-phosphate isomerase, class I [Corynebacterium marinum]
MQKLTGTLRSYPWGSRTLIPELRGLPSPSTRPEAELWFGAHPVGSSTIQDRALTDIIAADPVAALGSRVYGQYGDNLPFLLKILAAAEPLSLQAHPSAEQAREGFERENRLGIPLNAGNRNYRDPRHKPELVVALTDFHAMVGFRPLDQTLELFAVLACPELDRYLTILDPAAETDSLRGLFTTWITIPSAARRQLIDAVVAAARNRPACGDWISGVLSTVLELQERYPGDIGVLGALLLNHLQLSPGEALYLDAGHLHAYVSGLGVEVMANSDNVLRGGLTSKYVDVPELVRILDFTSLSDPVVTPVDGEYVVPAGEFRLLHSRLTAGEELLVDHDGPSIALCTSGTVTLGDLELSPGEAVWIPACDPACAATSASTGELFIARA